MAELSKLLAFMFKEDKEDILAQYNKMLDESDDEQALLCLLYTSPSPRD